MNFKKKSVNILGVEHSIEYVDSDQVDESKLWGLYESYDRKITLYDSSDNFEKFHILLHEVMHSIGERFSLSMHTNLPGIDDKGIDIHEEHSTEFDKYRHEKNHQELHLLAYGITDFLFRNKLLKDL